MNDLPDGCSPDAEVYGTDGRVWPTAVVLLALVLAWLGYGVLGDDPSYTRSVWFPALAALFFVWMQWDASRNRVVLDRDQLWVKHRSSLLRRHTYQGPLAYTDVIAAQVGFKSPNMLYLANSVGLGGSALRPYVWGFPASDPIIGRLATASVLSVPKLARTATNKKVLASLGQKLLDADVRLAPHAVGPVQRAIRKAAAS